MDNYATRTDFNLMVSFETRPYEQATSMQCNNNKDNYATRTDFNLMVSFETRPYEQAT